MERGAVTLEIFIDPNHPERVSGPETKGLRHIAFTADNLDGQPIKLKERTVSAADYNSEERWVQERRK